MKKSGKGPSYGNSKLNSPAPRGKNSRPSIKTQTGTTTSSMKPGVKSRGA